MPGFSREDEAWMAEAIALGRSHLGMTAPNPAVGCLIVRDGTVVGAAATALGGRPHAEPQALALAGEAARGATAYVSLEPCSHQGRTPPCADALVKAGLARVVAATLDPNPLVAGRGMAILADAGVVAERGLLQGEARRAHAGHIRRVTAGRPSFHLKLAVSADGFIGLEGRGQVPITGPEAREVVHRLRAESDAILVGIGTAIADDPSLTCRLAGLEDRSPVRVVLDTACRLPVSGTLAMTARQVRVIDLVGPDHDRDNAGRLAAQGVEVVDVPCDETGRIDLRAAAARLNALDLTRVMVEGGAAVAQAFVTAGLIDEVHLFESARMLGAGGIPALAGLPVGTLKSGAFRIIEERPVGADRLTVAWGKEWM